MLTFRSWKWWESDVQSSTFSLAKALRGARNIPLPPRLRTSSASNISATTVLPALVLAATRPLLSLSKKSMTLLCTGLNISNFHLAYGYCAVATHTFWSKTLSIGGILPSLVDNITATKR